MTQSKRQQEGTAHEVICYVDREGVTVLRCPDCETIKTIDTKNKDYAFKTFKAKCKCGASIKGWFEFRQYHRKKVKFAGSFKNRKTGVRGKIVVENISLMGVGFRCLNKRSFRKGDQLDITFSLDNPAKSVVKLWVEVQNVKDGLIGVKRCDAQLAQPELGFYLR